jgi:hypothetical protein
MAGLADVAPEAAAPATAEAGQEHHSAELAGIAPGLDDESQEVAAEAPEGERPQ